MRMRYNFVASGPINKNQQTCLQQAIKQKNRAGLVNRKWRRLSS